MLCLCKIQNKIFHVGVYTEILKWQDFMLEFTNENGFARTVKDLRDKYSKTAPQGLETYESTCGDAML